MIQSLGVSLTPVFIAPKVSPTEIATPSTQLASEIEGEFSPEIELRQPLRERMTLETSDDEPVIVVEPTDRDEDAPKTEHESGFPEHDAKDLLLVDPVSLYRILHALSAKPVKHCHESVPGCLTLKQSLQSPSVANSLLKQGDVLIGQSTASTESVQQLFRTNPLLAAILVNCTTASLITQLANSVSSSMISIAQVVAVDRTHSLPDKLSELTQMLSALTNLASTLSSSLPGLTTLRDGPDFVPTRLERTEGCSRLKRFSCQQPDCSRGFYSKFNLIEHLRTHTGERPFTCSVTGCKSGFKRRRDLAEHHAVHAFKRAPEPCQPPNVNADPRDDCGFLELSEDASKALNPDARDSDPDGESSGVDEEPMRGRTTRRHFCPYPFCSRSYARRHRLNQHMCQHTGVGPYYCDQPNCSVKYFCASDLERHKLIHLVPSSGDPIKRHLCPLPCCGKAYSKLNKLREHVRSHTGERPYVCDYPGCSASFIRLYGLKRHQLTHGVEKMPFAQPKMALVSCQAQASLPLRETITSMLIRDSNSGPCANLRSHRATATSSHLSNERLQETLPQVE